MEQHNWPICNLLYPSVHDEWTWKHASFDRMSRLHNWMQHLLHHDREMAFHERPSALAGRKDVQEEEVEVSDTGWGPHDQELEKSTMANPSELQQCTTLAHHRNSPTKWPHGALVSHAFPHAPSVCQPCSVQRLVLQSIDRHGRGSGNHQQGTLPEVYSFLKRQKSNAWPRLGYLSNCVWKCTRLARFSCLVLVKLITDLRRPGPGAVHLPNDWM